MGRGVGLPISSGVTSEFVESLCIIAIIFSQLEIRKAAARGLGLKKYLLGRVDDIPEEKGVAVQVGRKTISVFKIDGELYAIHNRCTHKGASLCEGIVDKGRKVIRCPWHLWDWSLETGCLESYPKKRMPIFRVEVIEGEAFLQA